MAPPVRVSQSWRGRRRWRRRRTARRCCPRRRRWRPRAAGRRWRWRAPAASSGAGRPVGPGRRGEGDGRVGGAELGDERVEGGDRVVGAGGQHVDLAALGHEVAGLARVGEERDRRLGVDQHQVAEAVELHGGELGEVAEAVDGGQPGAALEAGGEGLAEQRRAGRRGDPAGGDQARLPHARPPRKSAAFSPERRASATERTTAASTAVGAAGATGAAGVGALGPRHVGGQDQRGDAAAAASGPRPRPRPRRRRRPRCVVGRAQPARHVAGDGLDVGVERRVVLLVVRGVVADDVDDRGEARRALCRLASPLPSPGPRCSRVAAGRSAMRP